MVTFLIFKDEASHPAQEADDPRLSCTLESIDALNMEREVRILASAEVFEYLRQMPGSDEKRYVQILRSGEKIDPHSFHKQLNKLKSNANAFCLLRVDSGSTLNQPMPGPLFLFHSFNQLRLPAVHPEQILIKADSGVQVDTQFSSLIYTDLAFQLARKGEIIIEHFEGFTSPPLPRFIDEWLLISQKYQSILRCLGWSQTAMLERLVEASIDVADWLKLSRMIGAEQEQAIAQLLRSSNPDLIQSAKRIMQNGKVSSRQKGNRIVVFEAEIQERELELQRLLQSPSWRYTKWLRDCNHFARQAKNLVHSQLNRNERREVTRPPQKCQPAAITPIDYLAHLEASINNIHQSKSWLISAPLRHQENSERRRQLSLSEAR